MIKHRPCGECRELVPADKGCRHWSPRARQSIAARRQRDILRKRKARADARAKREQEGQA